MSTYIIQNSMYSGQVIMNLNNVKLSNDPVLSLTQSGSPVTSPGTIGNTLALYYPYVAVGDTTNQAVYIYKTDGSTLSLDTTITSPDSKSTDFATSISMKDKFLAIGSPSSNSDNGAVFVYYLIDESWDTEPRHTLTPSDSGTKFGGEVLVTEHYIAVSAPDSEINSSKVGSVHLFQYDYVQNSYSLEASLVSNNPVTGNGFGSAMSIIGDDIIMISSPNASVTSGTAKSNAGIVEIFNKSSGSWAYSSVLNSTTPVANGLFGTSISAQIGRTIIGEPGSNIVHIFDYNPPNWNIFQSLSFGTTTGLDDSTVAATDQQGLSVAQDISERSLIWSSPDNNSSGSVYVVETTQAGNIVPSVTYKLTPSDSASGELFGSKIVYNGKILVCLAPGGNSGNGEIFLFTK